MASADDISEKVATSAATGISSASADGKSVSAHSLSEQMKAADWARRNEADTAAANDSKRWARFGWRAKARMGGPTS